MNPITKMFLENIIVDKKVELKGLESEIKCRETLLSSRMDHRDRLKEEIEALEKDLNN